MQHKSLYLSLFSVFWLGILAAAPAAEGAAGKIEPAPLLSASEIAYPPFCLVGEDGEPEGFSVELLRAALKAMDRDVTFRTGPWEDVRAWLEKGDVQVLPLVGRTPEREAIFDFTFPYLSLHGALVVREETAGIYTLNDLKGKKVAVMKGDNAEEFLRRGERGIDIIATPTFEEALRELAEGRCDAVLIQRLVALRLIRETGLDSLKVINQPVEGFNQDFCFAVREGDRETLALLNEGLSLVIADETYRRLYSKWFATLELPTQRRIIVGGDHNYPPFEYLDENGRPAGYNVDITRAIAYEMGLDVEIRLAPWAETRKALELGEIDVLQGMLYSRERDEILDFSQPHTINHYVSVVRAGESPPPATLRDLAGKDVVVQKGDIMNDYLADNNFDGLIAAVDSQEMALRELSSGMHDCALIARITALYLIEKQGWKNLEVGREPFLSPDYCFAALENNDLMLTQFSEGLKVLEETGEYRRIYNKWMGVYEKYPEDILTILKYIGLAAIPFLLILTAFLLWSWSLRKQVALRTAELRSNEERWRSYVLNAPYGVFILDKSGKFRMANPAVSRITGYQEPELLEMNFTNLLANERLDEDSGHFHGLLASAESDRDLMFRNKNGNHRWWSVVAVRLPENQYLGFLKDITEEKMMQAQLLQSQKMESVGRLAGGVAHDFNNMLSIILGNAEMILQDIDDSDPMHENITGILQAGQRSANLTRQLLAFARKQAISPKVLDLNHAVSGMMKMLGRLIGEHIELLWNPGKSLWPVRIDPTQLDQVLANLCVNARDAIKGSGKIIIGTGKVELDEKFCSQHIGSVPGDYVLLSVSDNGPGIKKEYLSNIFDPFFTTKSEGEGTGLGLAMVYGIVKQNNGFIYIESEPGNGTVVSVYFPAIPESETESEKASPQNQAAHGAETILLVEDEEPLLELTARILEKLGYKIIPFNDPLKAVEKSRDYPGDIHLLLTDVVMPSMNGLQLHQELKKHRPGLKCVFISGYTADVIAHHGLLEDDLLFLQKPFTTEALSSKIREALDE